MTGALSDALLAALGAQGDAVAVLDGAGAVVARGGDPRLLGDDAAVRALAGRALDGTAGSGPEPVLLALPSGARIEVRATVAGGFTVVVGRDCQERERLRRELARAEEILAVGSHELKGPLHVIGMICHLIETRTGRGDPVDKATLDRLRRQVTRLSRLLNELLDVARLREGRLVLDLEVLDLAELLVEQVEAATSPRTADVHLDLPPTAAATGDRSRLGAVLFQLLDNAVRFTPPGTAIDVTLAAAGAGWRLSVRDHGPGVATDEVPHLFSREASPTRAERPAAGLGLGLHLAAAVVRLHGGTLAYAAAPGGGALFTVDLPPVD